MFWFLIFGTRVSAQGCQGLMTFVSIIVLFRFHFLSVPAPNQVEPKALVFEPKLTVTFTIRIIAMPNENKEDPA